MSMQDSEFSILTIATENLRIFTYQEKALIKLEFEKIS